MAKHSLRDNKPQFWKSNLYELPFWAWHYAWIVDLRGMTHVTCLMTFFACVFHTEDGLRRFQCPELEDYGWENAKLPADPEFVWNLLLQLDPHVSMWLHDGIHSRILKELADVSERPLSIICEQSLVFVEFPADWKLSKVVSVFKKCKKDDSRNYRPVGLTSVPDKIMEMILELF